MRAPSFHRWLVGLYPRWFREEFAGELFGHLARQRAEPRYRRHALGGLRFAWDTTLDALKASLSLRWEELRERWATHRRTSPARPPGHPVPPPPRRLAAAAEGILRDLRHALRGVVANPGYSLVFIVTLGLGIGANTAMFSAVNGVLLRPLPHRDGDRLVYLRHAAPRAGIDNALFSVPEIDDYRQGVPSLDAVAEFSALSFTMLGYDQPRRVRAGIVTGNYFGVMGLSASIGRTVGPEDDGEEAPAVIVLSDGYWKTVFGGDPGVLGRTVSMNGRTATIVGVAEPAPPYPERTDIYVNMAASPHHLDAAMNHDRIHRMTEVFARLAPEASVESARAEIETVTTRLHADYPEAYDAGTGYEVSVTPLKTQLTARARPTLLLLLVTALFVLIIACANLANLTLTRVLRRDHELAIRASLGGSRATLRRGLLVESLLLAGAGAGLGLFLAHVSLDVLVAFAARFTSRAAEIALDGTVLGVTLLVAVGASVFFTMLPPLPGADHLSDRLTRSGTRTVGSGARRAQRALVVAQIGISFVLLIGAGLLLRTMLHLNRIDPGFDTAQVLSLNVPAQLGDRDAETLQNYYLGIRDDLYGVPGVESVALTSAIPLAGGSSFTTMFEMKVEGHEPAPGVPTPRADFRVVSPGYFETMGIERLAGRDFQSTDVEGAAEVVIINEAMARAYFGDRHPIGQRIAWTAQALKFIGEGSGWRTVVGVVADTRDGGLDAEVIHTVYNPFQQIHPLFSGSLVLRMTGDPMAAVPVIRETILARDPNQPITGVATIADLGHESVAPRRLNTLLLGAFAVLALIIAAVGIGGVLAFSVGSRRREFGVRSALGAARRQVWAGVLAEGAALAGIGVAIGAVGAVFLARFLTDLLVGVPALDVITFVAVGLLLGGVAMAAAWIPAWRAAGVSPMEAMYAE